MADFEAVTPDELGAGDETPGIDRKVAFETENNIVVEAHVTGGTESGWHHHGDRHVYGYLREGTAAFEYGPGANERNSTPATSSNFSQVPYTETSIPATTSRCLFSTSSDRVHSS